MHARYIALAAVGVMLVCGSTAGTFAQAASRPQNDATPAQRLEVMRSRLEVMRRSLNSAISSMSAKGAETKKTGSDATADDPRARLRGLEQEVNSVLSEVNDIRAKQDRSERYDSAVLDRLETSVADLNTRVQAGLQATAGDRSVSPTAAASSTTSTASHKKKKGHFLKILPSFGGGGGNDKYEELTGTVAPGRDRVLFEEATKQVRKGNHEVGRLLFNTIITTYPDSPYLPAAKLAIADSFYLEGSTSSLIQAAAAYQDWLTFFPTHPLADDAMLKIAESEMRQMGLPDRSVDHARKAEQRLKVILQQFPQTPLRQEVQARLNEVQENLAMHNLQIGRFYYNRNENHKGGLKGAQSRFREIVEKYPNFSYMDEVLYLLGVTYMEEEEPDEAAKYFQMIVRDWPNSPRADKAREQLNVIGAPVPDPDLIKKNLPQPVRPSFSEKLISEVLGRANVNVDKNGVLISRDGKGGNDLIDRVIERSGQLPDSATPVAPRTPPAGGRPSQQDSVAQPAKPTGPFDKKVGGVDIKLKPTPAGPPPDRINPATTANPVVTPQGPPKDTTNTTPAPPAGTKP